MTKGSVRNKLRTVFCSAAMITGFISAFLASQTHISWGMIIGSGVEIGSEFTKNWLMNLTEACLALGVLIGGRIVDKGKLRSLATIGISSLIIGMILGLVAQGSTFLILFGLGICASLGSGMMLALAFCVLLKAELPFKASVFGLSLFFGLLAVEFIWGSASILSLAKGPSWILKQATWIGGLSALVGGGLLIIGNRLQDKRPRSERGRLPFWGPKPVDLGVEAVETPTFWIILLLAFLATFCGLLANRAGAALSVIGLPEGSFSSGVLVGYTFALSRLFGAFFGSVAHDFVGPKVSAGVSLIGLGATILLLSLFTGPENPWHLLIGSVGVMSGWVYALAPIICVHLLGKRHFGYHFGFLYLSIAVGKVVILPLVSTIESSPQTVLLVVGSLCFIVGILGFRMRAHQEKS